MIVLIESATWNFNGNHPPLNIYWLAAKEIRLFHFNNANMFKQLVHPFTMCIIVIRHFQLISKVYEWLKDYYIIISKKAEFARALFCYMISMQS